MVVCNLDIVRISITPSEANSPPLVNPNAVLALAITRLTVYCTRGISSVYYPRPISQGVSFHRLRLRSHGMTSSRNQKTNHG